MTRAEDKTILVVDDEPNVRFYLANILEDAGFKVMTASDGIEALEIIRQSQPDFISLDLVMPRKSGHKLLYELRKDKELSRIPVLIVTAHATDEMGKNDLDDILENRMISGPGTYLEKPVKPIDYVRSIQRALGIAESPNLADAVDLKDQLMERIKGADPAALQNALEALEARKKNET
ncbi:MAG: response regulator [candidate division Zixibacteria bacterium]|nr:response regulator [candidate division Zixibacteria bacterium]